MYEPVNIRHRISVTQTSTIQQCTDWFQDVITVKADMNGENSIEYRNKKYNR